MRSASSKLPRSSISRAPAATRLRALRGRRRTRGRQHDRVETRPRGVRGGGRGGVAGRRADDRARAGLDRARDRDDHAAVLEAAGRVRALELQVQVVAGLLREAPGRDERGRALAERDEPGVCEVTPIRAPRRRDPRSRAAAASARAPRAARRAPSSASAERARARLVRDDVQRGAVAVRLLQEARDRDRRAAASSSATRASAPGPVLDREAEVERRAAVARRAGVGSSRHAASFCRKPVPIVPITLDHVGDHGRRGLDAAGARALRA